MKLDWVSSRVAFGAQKQSSDLMELTWDVHFENYLVDGTTLSSTI
jgi:hypothetical protein